MFVILRFEEDYGDHCGGYFYAISDTYKGAEKLIDHIGRNDVENTWFEIMEVSKNFIYDEDHFTHN